MIKVVKYEKFLNDVIDEKICRLKNDDISEDEDYDEDEDNAFSSCGKQYDEDEDYDEDDDENNELNNNTMTLKTLREEPREYKGIKSVLSYIDENFKDVRDQFTPTMVRELIGEIESKDKKSLVIKYENRLYSANFLTYATFNYNSDIKKPTIEDIIINSGYYSATCIDELDSRLNDIKLSRNFITIKDIYFIDYIELVKLEAQALEVAKQKFIDDLDKKITTQNELISDMVKFNITNAEDVNKISSLKALEVVKNMKTSTDEQLVQAFRDLQ